MSTWPSWGASGGPGGGGEDRKSEPNTVRPTRSDSSQQASLKPGAVQTRPLGSSGRSWPTIANSDPDTWPRGPLNRAGRRDSGSEKA